MSPVNRLIHDTYNGQGNSNPTREKPNLKDFVKLPDQEDQNEWIAYNLVYFYKQIFMLFGEVSEHCTLQSCPKMTAGRKREYWWSDGPERRPVEVCAKDYIDDLLAWVQEQLDDDEIFPSSADDVYPQNFRIVCQTIARRLFRVYAHVYHHHLQLVKDYKEEGHMNTSLKYFIYFVKEFDLVQEDELDPLKDHIETLMSTDPLDSS